MSRRLSLVWTLALPLALLALMAPASASAEVQYGTLSNFDVFNDTGEETHGFEIELDGISSSDISYTFGAPYQARYGTPTIENFAGGVYVRYTSPYEPASKQFTQGTPLAPMPITPTMGHQCWTGGSISYFTSGCEHFGVGLLKAPTNTVYHWLVANPAKPGTLMTANTKVSVPTPEFEVKPPSVKEPAPVVKAVVKAPEPEGGQIWGPAVWVKVYETESEQPAELNHLLTDDPLVPQEPAQTETEWVLMQKEKGVANAAGGVASQKGLSGKHESVTRRYEIFKYTGPVDEEGEATPINEANPEPSEIGEYVGAQMDAANVLAGEPAPAVGKLSVKKGPAAGGTAISISGVNFTGASAVRFGSTEAKSFKVTSSKLITAESPAGPTGTVDVTVISPNGASVVVKGDKFTYENPTVMGVSPSTGTKAGGTSVTVTGSGFALGAATSIKFGSKAVVGVECTSSTTCIATTPAATKAATVDVTVKAGGKGSKKSAADRYTYN
jgi:hypothetical protein